MTNNSRGVMKIPTEGAGAAESITQPVRGGGTKGLGYDTIASLKGVVQMDQLDDRHAVILTQTRTGRSTSIRSNCRDRPTPILFLLFSLRGARRDRGMRPGSVRRAGRRPARRPPRAVRRRHRADGGTSRNADRSRMPSSRSSASIRTTSGHSRNPR